MPGMLSSLMFSLLGQRGGLSLSLSVQNIQALTEYLNNFNSFVSIRFPFMLSFSLKQNSTGSLAIFPLSAMSGLF